MKLSIITINYNNAKGLRKTLASVAAQTYADIEHIIVDGGSTDGSVEIIREYADNEVIRLQGYQAIRQEKNGKADDTLPNRPIAQSPDSLKRPTGLLFESDNADELAEKILWALEHPAEVQTIITNAQAEVQKYTWENVKQQLMKVYE